MSFPSDQRGAAEAAQEATKAGDGNENEWKLLKPSSRTAQMKSTLPLTMFLLLTAQSFRMVLGHF